MISRHINIVIKKIVHEQPPLVNGQIWIIINTVDSIFYLIVIDRSDLHLRSLVHVQRIFVIERNNLFLDLALCKHLFYDWTLVIRWSKTENSVCLKFSEDWSRSYKFKIIDTKITLRIRFFFCVEKFGLLVWILIFILS